MQLGGSDTRTPTIESGSVVIVHLTNPREKLWGLLVRLDELGMVIRGLDLNSVEDWLRQERTAVERPLSPSTVFVPMRRVERACLDESAGVTRSYSDRYTEACGRDVRLALMSVGQTTDDGPEN